MEKKINNGISKKEQKMLLQKTTWRSEMKDKIDKNKFLRIFLNIPVKLWQFVHYPIKKMNWLSFLSIIVLFSSITFAITFIKYNSKGQIVEYKQFGIMNRLEELKKTHEYYTKIATKDERLVRWIIEFSNWKYEVNGDPKYKRGDCVGSTYQFFQKWGSNIQLESIPWLTKRVENLSNRNELQIRKSIHEVVSGDIIILDVSPDNKHLGVVYDVKNGWIQFMDVNVATQGMGLERMQFADSRIKYVVEVSYSLWIGDLMQQLNRN